MNRLRQQETFGFLRPALDAHTLGISTIAELLSDCGYRVVIGEEQICRSVEHPEVPDNIKNIKKWITENRITQLGFSYRLDPHDAFSLFSKLVHHLKKSHLLSENGGAIRGLVFAGLPQAADLVKQNFGERVATFYGDENPLETLTLLGVPTHLIPHAISAETAYDTSRMNFAREFVKKGDYLSWKRDEKMNYPSFGTFSDSLISRLDHRRKEQQPPLTRSHAGPYLPDRQEAIKLFSQWAEKLGESGFLDILSIGTSQLSQSRFGQNWRKAQNGGGVPINKESEFRKVWEAARPMLVRTYAGTNNISALAEMYEKSINIAWHALSLWWFNRIDARGPLSLYDNLVQHFKTMDYIAISGKPFEANVSHHFAFRGGDDTTYVLTAYLAAKAARQRGIKVFVMQNMLNTPKSTWGIQDLAKSRAMLIMVKSLENKNFKVILQTRAGLDYLSHDIEKAKMQLASVTALMDDIDPENAMSPDIIHIVGYSEANHLADPAVIIESIKITQAARERYQHLRTKELIENMSHNELVYNRTTELVKEAKTILDIMEKTIFNLYSPEGFYKIFASGFLPVPYLWEGRKELHHAVNWKTKVINGGVKVVDENGKPVPALHRALHASEIYKQTTFKLG